MNDLKLAFRQLLKNPGFTIHPPQSSRVVRRQVAHCGPEQSEHAWQFGYGGRAVAVLTLALGIGANIAINRWIASSSVQSGRAVGQLSLELSA